MALNNQHINPGVQRRIDREYSKAVTAAENAVTAAITSYGEIHPQVADALCRLGELHQKHSDFDAAESDFTKALLIREQITTDIPGLVKTLRILACMYDISGQTNKAKPLQQRAAQIESDIWKSEEKAVESCEPEYDAGAEFVEDMAGSAPKTYWTELLGGIAAPFFAAIKGIHILMVGHVAMYSRNSSFIGNPLIIYGTTARMVGLVWICAALFIHFHFFWPYRNRKLCSYGKATALISGTLLLFSALARMYME